MTKVARTFPSPFHSHNHDENTNQAHGDHRVRLEQQPAEQT
jgi:hypothetical protein